MGRKILIHFIKPSASLFQYNPVIQPISLSRDYRADVLRLDLLHREISGNKWFKLKYNVEAARKQGHQTVLTFGGAFSNHIAATAAACRLAGLRSIAVIRGEEPEDLNPTLLKVKALGMHLHFVDRYTYTQKTEAAFHEKLRRLFGPHYLIPEGGNNAEGLLGCQEILRPEWDHDYVLCACGTATTFAGILASSKPNQKIIGVSVLKGENRLAEDARKVLRTHCPDRTFAINGNEEQENRTIDQSCVINAYCFNGYARFSETLLRFKNEFEQSHQIPLDHIYTGKLFFAAVDLVANGKLKRGSKLLIIHSGGLQGNEGFERRYL